MNLKAPSIFDYMDIRAFLQDYYHFQKQAQTGFSYTSWSAALGFSNKTLLRLIVQGKRQITLKTQQAFKETLSLSALEQEYFDVLVDYSQAKSTKQKQALGARLIQIHRKNFKQESISADSGILNDVYGPILLTIISSSDSPLSIDEIRSFLKIDVAHLKTVLTSLEKMNLIKCEQQSYVANLHTFKIADSFGHQGLKNFYKYWFEKSTQAIELPPEIRRFRSLQMALSQEEFEEIIHRFNEFVLELLSRVENNTINNRKIYLMNTALFPLLEKTS